MRALPWHSMVATSLILGGCAPALEAPLGHPAHPNAEAPPPPTPSDVLGRDPVPALADEPAADAAEDAAHHHHQDVEEPAQ